MIIQTVQKKIVAVALGMTALSLKAPAADWRYDFDGPDGELLKLYPNQPVGFPNADWIGNRTTDNGVAEFRANLGRVNASNATDPGETRAGSLFSYDDGVNGRNNDMVALHKEQFTLNPSSADLRITTSWSPYQISRTVTAGSQSGSNYIAQVGVMNTYDFLDLSDASPGINSPPANVEDDLWYSDRDLNRDGVTPNAFQREGLTDRDSFWLGFEEISAEAFVSNGGYAGRGTTTVAMGLYNENGLVTTLGGGNFTLDGFYNEYDILGNRTDGVYFYAIDFAMTYAGGDVDYVIAIDKYLVLTTFDGSNSPVGAVETFEGDVARFAGTVDADLSDTPTQILHVALGYDIQDYDNLSNEFVLYDFGDPIPEPGSLGLLLLGLSAAFRRSRVRRAGV